MNNDDCNDVNEAGLSDADVNGSGTSLTRVLFVCLGNICRSPTADGVFRHVVKQQGLADQILVDSCGTGSFHVGNPPDKRAIHAASKRNYDLSALRARQIKPVDFQHFHYILAMDRMNLGVLEAMKPEYYEGHVGLLLDFSQQRKHKQVPDPYYDGEEGFELVLDLIEDASQGLLADIQKRWL